MTRSGIRSVVGAVGMFATLAAAASLSLGQGPRPPGPPPPPPPGSPLAGLSNGEMKQFAAGKSQFLEVEDVPGGLGPVFTENSCAACHNAAAPGGAGRRLVTRIGRVVNGQFDPMVEFGGPLIQDQGIGKFNGVKFVGEVVPKQATIVARRRTTPLFGLGLVDAIPDAVLIALAQHEQAANPLTAGRISVVTDPQSGQNRVGRFGWKAQQPTAFAFAGDAYENEMGVTTPTFPNENCPQGNCDLLKANPATSQPNDADDSSVQRLADFLTFLAPAPTLPLGPSERAGQSLFANVGCMDCHMPTFQTGPSPVAALRNATLNPYSDFLLHDMGSLGDGIVQNTAGPREMKTAPLWGLRFQPSFLHDGRARTPEAAILAHDGQGRFARANYAALRPAQRAQLLAFLNSL